VELAAPKMVMSLDSCSITWAKLHLKAAGEARYSKSANEPNTYTIYRDKQLIERIIANPPLDTLIIDTTLIRGREYEYRAYRIENSRVIDSSNAVKINTINSASVRMEIVEALAG
jgi:hypothetical protein